MIQPLFIFSDWGILVLRVVLGLILVFHGWPKIKNIKGTVEWMSQTFKPSLFWATAVSLVEFVGGLMLIFGFLTQPIALLVAIQFSVIILKVNRQKGFVGGYEFDLLILAAALALVTLGSGTYALDDYFGLWIY